MASANRLQLDFKLTTTDERASFLNEYLRRPEFTKRPPTSDELETMGNYLLWGKDPVTGLNAKQTGLVDIETRHGTWDRDNCDSLDELLEQPTFNEASLQSLGSAPIKVKREVFSRREALAKCPDYLVETFTELFRQIDELDLAINYYELAHNRRKNPPREELLRKFSAEEQQTLQEKATHWNQYKYLKKRHELVELRREQYTLRDSYAEPILLREPALVNDEATRPQLNADIEVLPLGTCGQGERSHLIFRPWEEIIPTNYTEEQLQLISDVYWAKQKYTPSGTQMFIDFRELEHIYEMFLAYFDLEDAAAHAELESNMPELMRTLRFYVERADLTPLQRELLDMKLNKETHC